jgi:hypothetical protein
LRHSRNTSRDVYRPRARPPYCLRRHTLLLRGFLAIVVTKRHIAYSMHVTRCFIQIWPFSGTLYVVNCFPAFSSYRVKHQLKLQLKVTTLQD